MSLPTPPTPHPPTPAPNLTASQVAAVVALSNALQSFFYNGVKDVSGNLLIPGFDSRYQSVPVATQQLAIDSYRGTFAALLQVLAGLTTTVGYMHADGVTTGTLTFTNGILTSAT